MNIYSTVIILLAIAFVLITFIIQSLGRESNENKIKKSRTKGRLQREDRYATNSMKKQLADVLNEKAEVTKKYKIETLCLQAGYDMSYGEYKILQLVTSLVISILLLLSTKNVFLVIVFVFIGHSIPGQYFKSRANKRTITMEQQVGSFIKMLLERYNACKDMSKAISQTLPDFKGSEPFYSLLKNSVADLNMGKPIDETLDGLVRATGNKYLSRFTDYYKMTDTLSTHESKLDLLEQAYEQYKDNERIKSTLKEKISGPVKEAYVMVCAVPIFGIYQAMFSDGYLDFMFHTRLGQIGFTFSISVLIGCIWFINTKIGAPIE